MNSISAPTVDLLIYLIGKEDVENVNVLVNSIDDLRLKSYIFLVMKLVVLTKFTEIKSQNELELYIGKLLPFMRIFKFSYHEHENEYKRIKNDYFQSNRYTQFHMNRTYMTSSEHVFSKEVVEAYYVIYMLDLGAKSIAQKFDYDIIDQNMINRVLDAMSKFELLENNISEINLEYDQKIN